MPKRKVWKVLVLPPRNEPAQNYEFPGWTFRALIWGGVTSGLVVAWALFVLISPWGTPGSRLAAAQNEVLQEDIARIEERFRVLDDTLRSIARREEQMRMLAGLPVQTATLGDTGAVITPVLANVAEVGSGLGLPRRPFLGRLGWSARPDIEGLISRASDLSNNFRDVSDTLERNYQRFANTPSILPTAGWLSSQFSKSRFHPILHENRPHEGIDVTAPTGTPIVAPAAGRVVFAGTDKGYGLLVEIDHGNGIRTRFAHASRLAVRTGQQVTRNQLIAAVGSTGLSTAPHLHYEIHVNGKPVDPLTYVLPDAVP